MANRTIGRLITLGLMAVAVVTSSAVPAYAATPAAETKVITSSKQVPGSGPLAAPPGVLVWQIKTLASPRCLDADVNSIGRPGTTVHLWDCAPSLPYSQFWEFVGVGDGNWLIKNAESGRCLDADMGSIGRNGTKVHLWDCQRASGQFGYAPNQVWYQWLTGGRHYWVNALSRRCLDADASSIGGNGTKIHLWECRLGAANQSWVPDAY